MKRPKNIHELHDEHQRWDSSLQEFHDELEILKKKTPDKLMSQWTYLNQEISLLNQHIAKHEKTLSENLKNNHHTIHEDLFEDHDHFRHLFSKLQSEMKDFRVLLSHR